MLHLKNNDFKPKDATILLKKSREFCSGMNVTIRDTRVSSKYIEFDISIEQKELDMLIEKLQPIGSLEHAKHVIEEKIEKEKAVKDGIFFFNDERFWECHEVLEGVWKNCSGDEKILVQGLILVAAALVHYQKDEDKICLSVLGRAMDKFTNASGKYHQIDIDDIKNKVTQILKTGKISTFEI